MSGLLAMGTPPTTNDVGRYYFWLSHNWQFLVPSAFVVCALLIGLVVHFVKGSSGATPGSSQQPEAPSQTMDLTESQRPAPSLLALT